VKTPYDQDALVAERTRNKSDIKLFRRARKLWMQNQNIVSCRWVEDVPLDGEYVSRMEDGRATAKRISVGAV